MVNQHKIMNANFAAMIAVNKANREGRDVTISDFSEAHELVKEGLIKRVVHDKKRERK